MPKYEYYCPRYGLFADFRPLAEYDLPVACPTCSTESPRTALCFPAMRSMSSSREAALLDLRRQNSAKPLSASSAPFQLTQKN